MALITIKEYIEKYFSEESRPNKNSVWRWVRDGILPAQKLGKRYYIDTDVLDKKRRTGNRLADKILNESKL